MPAPAFRHPSQGATAATKRAFKPPGPARGGSASAGGSSSSSNKNPTTHEPTRGTTTNRAVSSKAALASGSKSSSWINNKTGQAGGGRGTGFQSAAQLDQEDLEAMMVVDSDSDSDDDFGLALANAKRPAPTTTTTSTTTSIEPGPSKRQKTIALPPPRLPSLSPLPSSAPQPISPAAPRPPRQHPAATIGGPSDDIPLLKPPLLTRLLHESYEDKDMKITKEANGAMARYLDFFVREAVARSTEVAKERREVRRAGGLEVEGEVWLEVQDLEDVAPGLVLDF